MALSAGTKITVHETPAEIYAEMARAFGEHSNAGHRWVSFKSTTGVDLMFFGIAEAPPEESS